MVVIWRWLSRSDDAAKEEGPVDPSTIIVTLVLNAAGALFIKWIAR